MKRMDKQARTGIQPVSGKRPVALFTFVQVMGMCAMAIVAATMVVCALGLFGNLTAIPNFLLMEQLNLLDTPLWMVVIPLLAGAGVGGCLLWILAEFVLMCGRVRRDTAFTAANVRALGRIVLAFVIGGVLLLPLGRAVMDWLLTGMRGVNARMWSLLPTFAAWAAALLVRAIQVLMRRAVEMQTEQDLTV